MTRTLVAFSLLERWILTAWLDLDACTRASCDTSYNVRTISAAQPAVLHSIPTSDVSGQGEMRPCARALKTKSDLPHSLMQHSLYGFRRLVALAGRQCAQNLVTRGIAA